MTSAERNIDYVNIKPEAELYSSDNSDNLTAPPEHWPSKGEIQATLVSMAYAPDAPPALKNLNFTIESHEKVMIIKLDMAIM